MTNQPPAVETGIDLTAIPFSGAVDTPAASAIPSPRDVFPMAPTTMAAATRDVIAKTDAKEVIRSIPSPRKPNPGSSKFLDEAKKLVVDNYNAHRNRERTPPLTTELVDIVWFAKALGNWKAVCVSPVAKGLLYEVSYNGHRSEASIEIYKRINNVKISY